LHYDGIGKIANYDLLIINFIYGSNVIKRKADERLVVLIAYL